MMALTVDAMPALPPQGGGAAPISDQGRSGEPPAWRRALERAAVSGLALPAGSGLGVFPLPVAATRPATAVHGPTLAAASAAGRTSEARPGAEPSRCGDDPAGVARLAREGRRRHAGVPLCDFGAAVCEPARLLAPGEENPTCRGLPASAADHRHVRPDVPAVRVHVETNGASASVWMGVDSSAAHVLDEAVAAVGRWLVREGCADARWVCNGREFEAPRLVRLRAAASLPADIGSALAPGRGHSSGGTP